MAAAGLAAAAASRVDDEHRPLQRRGGFHIRPEGLPLPQRPRANQWSALQTKAHPAHSCRMSCGWVGEVRTHECGSQSPVPYHLATTHYKRKRPCRNAPVRSLVGCLERFELSASRATIWRANQLRHRHHIMRPKGLEPPAHCLEGSCSIQLSYGALIAGSCPRGTYCVRYYSNGEPGCQAFLQNFFYKSRRDFSRWK